MVPKKKSLEAQNTEKTEALEQTFTELENDAEKIVSQAKDSTILSSTNGIKIKAKAKSLSKRNLRTIIALIVSAVLIGAAWFSVDFIPEKEDETINQSPSILVKKTAVADIEKINLYGSKANMVFYSTIEDVTDYDGNTSKEYVWALQGYEKNLIASSAITAAADAIATLYASRVMEQDQSQKALYGFNKPTAKAEVIVRKGENFTLFIGDKAPDNSGYYATVTGDEKIYLVTKTSVDNFNTTPEALADTSILSAPTVDDIVKKTDKKYFDSSSGELTTFESITLSGSRYGKTAVISPIEDNEFVKYNINLGKFSRYANPDVVDELFSLMTGGLFAVDTYALHPTAAQLKKYGLDKPEVDITVKCGSLNTVLKASLYDAEGGHYAVMVSDRNAIYSVTADALAMLDYEITDYYYQFVFQDYLYSFKNMTVNAPSKTYSFDIKYNESDNTIIAKSGDKKVDDALLSAYYQYFLTLQPEVKDNYTDGPSSLTAVFTYTGSTRGKLTMEFVKQSGRRYLLKIDGNAMGTVTSTAYDHLVVYAEYVMTNKGIPEP